MASSSDIHDPNNPKKARTRLSYIIKDNSYDHKIVVKPGINLHRQGINALVIDYDAYANNSSKAGGYLYSGARDSVINKWELSMNSSTSTTKKHGSYHSNPIQIIHSSTRAINASDTSRSFLDNKA